MIYHICLLIIVSIPIFSSLRRVSEHWNYHYPTLLVVTVILTFVLRLFSIYMVVGRVTYVFANVLVYVFIYICAWDMVYEAFCYEVFRVWSWVCFLFVCCYTFPINLFHVLGVLLCLTFAPFRFYEF